MPTEVAKRGPGRPSKNKRGTFKFRVTDSLRTKMEAAASKSNRSVSEEIEHRLEHSLASDFLLAQLMGNEKNARLLKIIAMRLSGLDQQAVPWHSHPDSAERLLQQIQQAMDVVSKTDTREEAIGILHRLSLSELSSKAGMLTPAEKAHSAIYGSPAGGKMRKSKGP